MKNLGNLSINTNRPPSEKKKNHEIPFYFYFLIKDEFGIINFGNRERVLNKKYIY